MMWRRPATKSVQAGPGAAVSTPGRLAQPVSKARHVGVVDGALGPAERLASLAAQFPEMQFSTVPPDWHEHSGQALDLLIVAIAAADADAACHWLGTLPARTRAIVVLHDADVATTRKLMRQGGAADVLPAPVSEPAIASSLDRLSQAPAAASAGAGGEGRVVAILKAGGGVGATALAVQACTLLARGGGASVCLADLDLQFGAASGFFDLPSALTVMDCLTAGSDLAETPFATALATHASGARLLAAPQDVTPLDAISPADVEALLIGLRRACGLTLLDLPSAWAAWTSQALQRCDAIVLVTRLTVPHIQQLKRQLRLLSLQQLDRLPLTLVCNAVSPEQLAFLLLKVAEKALGRAFDLVIPEDRKLMTQALNQGVELSAVRRGTRLEKSVAALSQAILAGAPATAAQQRG